MSDASLTPVLLQSILAAAATSTGAAIVGGFVSHRSTRAAIAKTVAETGRTEAEIVSAGASAAATQVETAMDMLREMRIDMTVLRLELADLQVWKRKHQQLMDAHSRWDKEVRVVLQDLNIDIPPPPPLRVEEP